MKNILLIAALIGGGWYGYNLYEQNKLPFLQHSSNGFSSAATKCITEDGSVLYGIVPEGVVCEKTEPVDGSLTIVDSLSSRNDGQGPYQREAASQNYRCDGRVYCSQMTSCEEAVFFLRNCPGTKMDGNNDGIPCERQWCN
ncbi:excalibur calcium-binding domain-containing protein [Imhoffiella purpurea]|uniref:excalibur calcium-binding domain-containing protein n=1 Tax=Imhoffiella purpurea TaxID=1249627 RepID=UPI0018DF0CC8